MGLKNIEIHIQSLIAGAAIGSIVTGLVVILLSFLNSNYDPSLMKEGLTICHKDQPIYLTRAGEYLHLKCNGHREDGPRK